MKRLLGFILTLVMVFSLFPAALAAEAEEPAEEILAEDIPVEEAPAEEAPVEEASVEEVPFEEVPVTSVPVADTPVEEASVEDSVEPFAEEKADSVALSAANFPDANFRSWLWSKVDANHDNVLDAREMIMVKKIDVTAKEIADLTGIGYFTELEELNCGKNTLTNLDVSRNTALTSLSCSENKLTSLDVSQNMTLTSLSCSSNLLTTLDVSRNTALKSLGCSSNQLKTLDVSLNTALTSLYCSSNLLTTLDVSKNKLLGTLECNDNQLTALDLNGHLYLRQVYCNNNQLTSLTIDHTGALTRLEAKNNHLTYYNDPGVEGYGDLSGQTVNATLNQTAEGYTLDLTTLMDLSVARDLLNNFTDLPEGSSLDETTGILTLPIAVPSLTYIISSRKLDVTIYLTENITAPTITSLVMFADGVQLRWSPFPGAAKYAFYRKAEGESKYTRQTITADTTYMDRAVEYGVYYYYRVWALDANGKSLGTWSNAKGVRFTPITAPTITYCRNDKDGIRINWSAIPGITRYAVYRRVKGEANFKRYTIVSAYTYIDRKVENGLIHEYRIWALDANGKTVGKMSNPEGVLCNRAPTIHSIYNKASGITISYSSSLTDVAKYAIYRKAAGESKYTRYTITTATSYTDKKAQEGVYYYYRVWALDANGKTIGTWSNARAITRTAS